MRMWASILTVTRCWGQPLRGCTKGQQQPDAWDFAVISPMLKSCRDSPGHTNQLVPVTRGCPADICPKNFLFGLISLWDGMSTDCSQTFWTPRGLGHPSKKSRDSQVPSLWNPWKENKLSREETKCSTTTPSHGRPTRQSLDPKS